MTREAFRALLDLYMMADNMLKPDRDSALLGFMEYQATRFGYKDWVDAYHTFTVEPK